MEHWEIIDKGQIVVSNDAEELWENAASYFRWCDDNPVQFYRSLLSGKEAGKSIKVSGTRPYSIKGLCLHCGILEEYLVDCLNSRDKTSLYYQVVKKIQYVIHTNNLEGAMVGVYNPVFTAKVLNMEKEEAPSNTVKVEMVVGLPQLSESENEILEKLNFENENGEIDKEQNP